MGSFATLIETATGPVSDADAESLIIMGAVVGGWGAIIVLFSVASTMGITVRQRELEIGLFRTIGGTPAQARRLIRVEALRGLRHRGRRRRGRGRARRPGPARCAARGGHGRRRRRVRRRRGLPRADRRRRRGDQHAGRRDRRTPGHPRPGDPGAGRGRERRRPDAVVAVAASPCSWSAAASAWASSRSPSWPTTADPYAAMSTAGSCSIYVGVGLADPVAAAAAVGLPGRSARCSAAARAGHLAAYNTSRRSHLLAGVLAPVIVLTVVGDRHPDAGRDRRPHHRRGRARPRAPTPSTCSTTSWSACSRSSRRSW